MLINIRKAQLTDARAIAGILRGLGWFKHFSAEPVESTEARVRLHLSHCLGDDSHSVYVAENRAGETIGYANVHWLPYLFLPGPEGYVSELFVNKGARGQGAGTQLLQAIKKEADERGCTRLSLLNIRQRESYQRGFYKQRGWEERRGAANFIYPLPAQTEK